MPGIDPTRLSRLLATLAKPAAQGSGNARAASTGPQTPPATTRPAPRDPMVLRARLRSRLAALRESAEDFQEVAPRVTVQEILRWEFGERVVEHAQFGQVADKVVAALLTDEKTADAIHRVIETLSAP